MIVSSKLVNFLEIFYETIFKSAIIYVFKLYYGSGKRFNLNCIDDVILAKSATVLAKEIRDRQVKFL